MKKNRLLFIGAIFFLCPPILMVPACGDLQAAPAAADQQETFFYGDPRSDAPDLAP